MASGEELDTAVEESSVRLDVLDATIELLAGDGLDAVSFDAVDREARHPQGTASELYRSREELLVAAAGRIVERLRHEVIAGGLLMFEPRPPSETVQRAAAGIDHVVTDSRTDVLALRSLRGVRLAPRDEIDVCDRAVRAFARSVARPVVDAGIAGTTDDVVAFFEAIADVTWAHLERRLDRAELERRVSTALETHLTNPGLRLVTTPSGRRAGATSRPAPGASRDAG